MKRIGWTLAAVVLGLAALAADKTSDTTTPGAILTALESIEKEKHELLSRDRTALQWHDFCERRDAKIKAFNGKKLSLSMCVTNAIPRIHNDKIINVVISVCWKSGEKIESQRGPTDSKGPKDKKSPKLTINMDVPVEESLGRTMKVGDQVNVTGRIGNLKYDESDGNYPRAYCVEITLEDGVVTH